MDLGGSVEEIAFRAHYAAENESRYTDESLHYAKLAFATELALN